MSLDQAGHLKHDPMDAFVVALKTLPPKPPQSASQAKKRRYSELLSQKIAAAFASELRVIGMDTARPNEDFGSSGAKGAERRMAGGIGAKKVDVTWSTEESGLLLAISIKTINFGDPRTKNFQKNVTNRRSDLLIEAVTLHRRFPYAIMAGVLFFDRGAKDDHTKRRKSTFHNTHNLLKLFTGRRDPTGRDEQFELLCIALTDANPSLPTVEIFVAGEEQAISLKAFFEKLLDLVVERNSDFYEILDGRLRLTSSARGG